MNIAVPMESKALRLARYLKEFVGLRTTTVRDVDKYEAVLWLGDMPNEPDCVSPAWVEGSEAGAPWLVVSKQRLPPLPEPPEAILEWIDQRALKQATEEMPPLRSTSTGPDLTVKLGDDEEPPVVERPLSEHPEVARAYQRYQPSWIAWSAEYRRKSRIQTVYADLFRLHTQVQKQGEIVELIMGLGLLSWPGKSPIRRHVVTARIDLQFDAGAGVIRVVGAADGVRLRIEDDMLDVRPDRSQYESVQEQLNSVGDDVWDRPLMFAALKSWAGALHADTQWSDDLRPAIGNTDRPAVCFAPALILRKRTQAGMVRIYNAIIEQLSKGDVVAPDGWEGLVEDRDDQDVSEYVEGSERSPNSAISPQEVYFPLPSNREQRRIVEAIDKRRGVLVQGPPGTGKSHTIANLMCHLLATGKKVLITAETSRALKVLKNKLPEELQPLCVSLLGQGGDSFAELNSAVQGITTRYATWRPDAYDQEIGETDRELDAKRRALAKIDTELRSLREDETLKHSLINGEYQGTASEIAGRICLSGR